MGSRHTSVRFSISSPSSHFQSAHPTKDLPRHLSENVQCNTSTGSQTTRSDRVITSRSDLKTSCSKYCLHRLNRPRIRNHDFPSQFQRQTSSIHSHTVKEEGKSRSNRVSRSAIVETV